MTASAVRQTAFLIVVMLLFRPSDSAAQDPDSLADAVNTVLAREFSRSGTSYSQDSALVEFHLSEAVRAGSLSSDSALVHIRKALSLSMVSGSPDLISLAVEDLGNYYLGREMYREAMKCFLTAIAAEEKGSKVPLRMAGLYDGLGGVYYYMEVFDKSLDYHTRALNIYRSEQDSTGLATVMIHLGMLHSSREYCEARSKEEKKADFDTAIVWFHRAATIYSVTGNGSGLAKAEQNIAAVYNKLEQPEAALGYAKKAYEYYRDAGDREGMLGTLFTLGKTWYRLREYDHAIAAFRESEKMAYEGNMTGGIQYLYEAMAMPYYDKGDYRNAYNCYIKYMTIRDSVYNAEKSRQIIELETKYQSQVKENEIIRLSAEKRRRNLIMILLTVVIILLIFAVNHFVRVARKNRIIAQKDVQIREEKIRELEKERLYLAARSVIEGQEAERSRLAGDLHNGLGGLLSGIKINLSTMKENAVITPENVTAFNHALSLLDTSISELRRIAHNLMPETLNHYGLRTALEDFCSQVAPGSRTSVTFSFFGEEMRYAGEVELTFYRVVQELVNNSLKHSGATEIGVQLFSEEKRLSAQVTDNGCGFDPAEVERQKRGKGIENIRDRIVSLNGRFDIWSKPGQGTEVSVEIDL